MSKETIWNAVFFIGGAVFGYVAAHFILLHGAIITSKYVIIPL